VLTLQEVAEAYINALLEDTNLCAIHRKAVTIISRGYAVGKKDLGRETVLGGHSGFSLYRQVLSDDDYFIVRVE
jgi:hypothetical protein